jgi:UDP-N-acetylglucosamine 2-epimerase (non-hydrolysing)
MLIISFGTRPEYIKIKPLLPLLDKENIPYKLLHIDQHTDLVNVIEPHDILQIYDISSNRLDNIHLNIVDQAENWLKDCRAILVQGDTTSAYSMALAAFNKGIKIIHLEAGLRTYDRFNPYPEEFNRRSISLMADVHLCPTNQNAKNLTQEGIRTAKYVVGNTVLDSINTDPVEESNTVLITLHRRENLPIIGEWFKEINKLSKSTPELRYIYPIHPNPVIAQNAKTYLGNNIQIVSPLSREDLITQIKRSKMIISDSGGIQEEACYLHKKIIICRKVTERPEAIWLNSTLCKTPEYLGTAFSKMINKKLVDYVCPYGSGNSSEKIIEILKKELA